jgi:aspartyl-tRNA synthetase
MEIPSANRYRDRWCGDLRAGDASSEVRVAGWVHRRRDHGGLIFIDLRDRSGLLQLVFHPDSAPLAHAAAHDLRGEAVLSVRGEIVRRDASTVNPSLATGDIELAVRDLDVLAVSLTPPFPLDEDVGVDETLRLHHRSLDLRREPMRDAMVLRHRVARTMRETLERHDFLEIETPILTAATPEGARDFLVPSRQQRGSFYALPQSPQLFKQLLMMGGFERYYQIARCFRDEDSRADRQPEFTQLDVEMSFVTAEDVLAVTEEVMGAVFAAGEFHVAAPPWPRMCYREAIGRFGSDRPDTRFGLELHDVSELVRGCEFKVFASVVESGGAVLAINAGPRELSRAEQDGRPQRVRPALRRQGRRADRRWRRRLAWKPRPVLQRRAGRRRERQARGLRRRSAAVRRRQGPGRHAGARRAAPGARGAVRADRPGPPRCAVDRRVPDVRIRRGGGALDRDAPPVHSARACRGRR